MLKKWLLRGLAVGAIVSANYVTSSAEAGPCYKCVACGGGSCCHNDGIGPGYTMCVPLGEGGCSPAGGAPCG